MLNQFTSPKKIFDASFVKILEFIKTNKTVDLNRLIASSLHQKQM